MDSKNFCVILAGDTGSRLWPITTSQHPKQFIDILGTGKSFLRQTFERFIDFVPVENFIILTNIAYREMVKRDIPEIEYSQILCEPCRRNTAPCILYAANRILSVDSEANMIITPADHIIIGERDYMRAINQSLNFVSNNQSIMTIGIEPISADKSFGYLQLSDLQKEISKVKVFTEKPSQELATTFFDCGEFLWNSGIYIAGCTTIIDAFKKYQEDLYYMFDSGSEYYNTDSEQTFINDIYPQCPTISIDYAIMEYADNIYIHKANFGWNDISSWISLHENLLKDKSQNSIMGDVVKCYDVNNSIIRVKDGKKSIIQGLDNFIVIDDDDSLLILSKDNEKMLKNYIKDIENL